MTLHHSQKIKLLNNFADFKRRQGAKSIVLQSLPVLGVQADEHFYSYDLIIKAIKKKIEVKNV
jgi:hypothetical protein